METPRERLRDRRAAGAFQRDPEIDQPEPGVLRRGDARAVRRGEEQRETVEPLLPARSHGLGRGSGVQRGPGHPGEPEAEERAVPLERGEHQPPSPSGDRLRTQSSPRSFWVTYIRAR